MATMTTALIAAVPYDSPSAVLLVNAVLCTAAAAVNFGRLRGVKAGFTVMRLVRGVLATVVAVGYWAQIAGFISPETRFDFGQDLQPFVWVLVWSVPAFMKDDSLGTSERVIERVAELLPAEPIRVAEHVAEHVDVRRRLAAEVTADLAGEVAERLAAGPATDRIV